MDLIEKSAHIKDLVEKMNLNPLRDETKILKSVVSLLEDIATDVKKLNVKCSENGEIIDELDESLAKVEDIIYGCEHANCGFSGEEENVSYRALCPNCENVIYLDDDMIAASNVVCSNCGEELSFNIKDDM